MEMMGYRMLTAEFRRPQHIEHLPLIFTMAQAHSCLERHHLHQPLPYPTVCGKKHRQVLSNIVPSVVLQPVEDVRANDVKGQCPILQ
jgi:hypothetical protein